MLGVGLGIWDAVLQGTSNPTPSAEAAAFLTRANAVATLTTKQSNAYVNFINGMVTASLWSKFDILYLFSAQSSGHAILNLVSSSFTATLANSPNFTQGYGFTGNGTITGINSNFNPATAPSPKFTQNSAHISTWFAGGGLETAASILGDTDTSKTAIFPNYGGPGTYMRLNDAASSGVISTTLDGSGMLIASRTSSTIRDGYWNGTSIGNANSATSGAVQNHVISFIAASDASPGISSTDQIYMGSAGSALTSTDAANFYALLTSYFAAVNISYPALAFTTAAVNTVPNPSVQGNILSTTDGLNFTAPSGVTNPVLTFPGNGGTGTTAFTVGANLLFSRSKYWMCYEVNDFTQGQKSFGIVSSSSLNGPWTWVCDVTVVTTNPGVGLVWNPHWFVDDNGDVYIYGYYTPTGAQSNIPFLVKCLNTTTYASWATATDITGTTPWNGNFGDFFMLTPNNSPLGLYTLWYRNLLNSQIECATSASITSGYTPVKTENVLGVGIGYEGITPIKLPAANAWRMYLYPLGIGRGWQFVDSYDGWNTFTGLRVTSLYSKGQITTGPVTVGPV